MYCPQRMQLIVKTHLFVKASFLFADRIKENRISRLHTEVSLNTFLTTSLIFSPFKVFLNINKSQLLDSVVIINFSHCWLAGSVNDM